MGKKALIVVRLVEESVKKANRDIEKEISENFQRVHRRSLGLEKLRR